MTHDPVVHGPEVEGPAVDGPAVHGPVIHGPVLILGGTSEARDLAARLASASDLLVISSLAGRVADPALPAGEVRQLASWELYMATSVSAITEGSVTAGLKSPR